MSTSQNGMPALSSSSGSLVTWNVPGAEKTRLRLRNGSAGFLLVHFAAYFDKKVEDLDRNYLNGALDDWAYAYRPVRGYSSTLSNHSSGTAIDLNATEHPLGREGTFSAEQEKSIYRRLAIYDGAIRWGGDYRGRKDEMHFEIDASLAKCEQVARRLMKETKVGKRILRDNPGQERVINS